MSPQITKLEKDTFLLNENGGGSGLFNAKLLPEGMAPSSAEVIASLNEHLIITLQVEHSL